MKLKCVYFANLPISGTILNHKMKNLQRSNSYSIVNQAYQTSVLRTTIGPSTTYLWPAKPLADYLPLITFFKHPRGKHTLYEPRFSDDRHPKVYTIWQLITGHFQFYIFRRTFKNILVGFYWIFRIIKFVTLC